MKTEKSIEVLNTLIEINNDRIEGYETASKETKETDLKDLFLQFAQTSKKCKDELVKEVSKLGSKPTEGTKTSGKFYRVWMDVKASLTSKDRKKILESCEFGEDAALDVYKKALQNAGDLTTEQNTLVNTQFASLKSDHNKVKNLRDMVVEHK